MTHLCMPVLSGGQSTGSGGQKLSKAMTVSYSRIEKIQIVPSYQLRWLLVSWWWWAEALNDHLHLFECAGGGPEHSEMGQMSKFRGC
jgi:hypothetical protein